MGSGNTFERLGAFLRSSSRANSHAAGASRMARRAERPVVGVSPAPTRLTTAARAAIRDAAAAMSCSRSVCTKITSTKRIESTCLSRHAELGHDARLAVGRTSYAA